MQLRKLAAKKSLKKVAHPESFRTFAAVKVDNI